MRSRPGAKVARALGAAEGRALVTPELAGVLAVTGQLAVRRPHA